jgi:hypothetical protein
MLDEQFADAVLAPGGFLDALVSRAWQLASVTAINDMLNIIPTPR